MGKFVISILKIEATIVYNPSEYYTFMIFDANNRKVYDNDDTFCQETECRKFAIAKLESEFNIKHEDQYEIEYI